MSATTPAVLLVLSPPPSPAYVAVDRALACPACCVTFTAQRACPACGSDDLYPLETFFTRRQGRAYTADTVAELTQLGLVKGAA